MGPIGNEWAHVLLLMADGSFAGLLFAPYAWDKIKEWIR